MDCIRSIEYVYFILDGILLIPGSFSVLGWPPWVYSLGIEEKKKPGTYINYLGQKLHYPRQFISMLLGIPMDKYRIKIYISII